MHNRLISLHHIAMFAFIEILVAVAKKLGTNAGRMNIRVTLIITYTLPLKEITEKFTPSWEKVHYYLVAIVFSRGFIFASQ